MKRTSNKIISYILTFLMIFGALPANAFVNAAETGTDGSGSESLILPDIPQNGQDYWVIFREGTRDNRIELTTCSISQNEDSAFIVWDRELLLSGTEAAGDYYQYYLDEDGKWSFIGNYHKFTDYATEVIASNLDVYDIDGNLIIDKNADYHANASDNDDFHIGFNREKCV